MNTNRPLLPELTKHRTFMQTLPQAHLYIYEEYIAGKGETPIGEALDAIYNYGYKGLIHHYWERAPCEEMTPYRKTKANSLHSMENRLILIKVLKGGQAKVIRKRTRRVKP